MENETPHNDLVVLSVQRAGASEDLESVLLLCDAWQAGKRGPITLEAPLFTVPALLTALVAAQGATQELQAASSATPTTPQPLPCQQATAAALPTRPSEPSALAVSFLLAGAWLHLQLDRPGAQALHAQLGRVLGSG